MNQITALGGGNDYLSLEEFETAADLFRTDHAIILAKTVETVVADDTELITAAITAYDLLHSFTQQLLVAERVLLDEFRNKFATEIYPDHYVIVGNVTTGFKAVKNSNTVATTTGSPNQTAFSDLINAIRNDASGKNCKIMFGNGVDTLNIGSLYVAFANATAPNVWGKITVSGKITSSNSLYTNKDAGIINVSNAGNINNISLESTADIINFYGYGIAFISTGVLTVSDGTVSVGGYAVAVMSLSTGAVNIIGGLIRAVNSPALLFDDNPSALVIGGNAVLFSNSDNIFGRSYYGNSVIALAPYQATPAISGNAVVVARANSATVAYTEGETTDLTTEPANTAAWTVGGIAYARGNNIGIIPIDGLTITSNADIPDFKMTHADILDKTANDVTVNDKTDVLDALNEYAEFDSGVKVLLTTEKVLLDNLLVQIRRLEAAKAYRDEYAYILGKTDETVEISDMDAVEAALDAYDAIPSNPVRTMLLPEWELLDGLLTRIIELEGFVAEADAFREEHSEILDKTVATVAVSDGPAVKAALDDYNALEPEAQDLLAAEKTKLDALDSKIETDIAAAKQKIIDDEKAVNDAIKAKEDANTDILAAVITIEDAIYTATQKDAGDKAKAKAAVEAIIAKLDLDGVVADVEDGDFNAATAGDDTKVRGTNGSYGFTVKLSKGTGDERTVSETLIIVATVFEYDDVSIRRGDRPRSSAILKQTVVSDEMVVVLAGVTKVVVYDALGNVVHSGTDKTWDLRNAAGRYVANGAYLVVVETKAGTHSAKVGVRR